MGGGSKFRGLRGVLLIRYPKGPYTACLKTAVPEAIPGILFGTRVLKWAVYGPFGIEVQDVARRVGASDLQQACFETEELRTRQASSGSRRMQRFYSFHQHLLYSHGSA